LNHISIYDMCRVVLRNLLKPKPIRFQNNNRWFIGDAKYYVMCVTHTHHELFSEYYIY